MQLPEYFKNSPKVQITFWAMYLRMVINKQENQINLYLGCSYGDPSFGIIDKNEQWVILLGHASYLWTATELTNLNKGHAILGEIFEYPFDARQIDDFEVEIIDDPWSDNPGIYSLNVKSKSIKRIRDFKKLEIPYEDDLKID